MHKRSTARRAKFSFVGCIVAKEEKRNVWGGNYFCNDYLGFLVSDPMNLRNVVKIPFGYIFLAVLFGLLQHGRICRGRRRGLWW